MHVHLQGAPLETGCHSVVASMQAYDELILKSQELGDPHFTAGVVNAKFLRFSIYALAFAVRAQPMEEIPCELNVPNDRQATRPLNDREPGRHCAMLYKRSCALRCAIVNCIVQEKLHRATARIKPAEEHTREIVKRFVQSRTRWRRKRFVKSMQGVDKELLQKLQESEAKRRDELEVRCCKSLATKYLATFNAAPTLDPRKKAQSRRAHTQQEGSRRRLDVPFLAVADPWVLNGLQVPCGQKAPMQDKFETHGSACCVFSRWNGNSFERKMQSAWP